MELCISSVTSLIVSQVKRSNDDFSKAKGLLKYSDDFSKAQGLNQLWQKDTATTAATADNAGFKTRQFYLVQSPTAKGTFSFRVPLKHIFGFCEDYDRIVYGLKHTLTLVRRSDDDAIFRADAADAGKVVK